MNTTPPYDNDGASNKVQPGMSNDVTALSSFAVIFVSVYPSVSNSHCLWPPYSPLSHSPSVSVSVHLSLSPLHHFLPLSPWNGSLPHLLNSTESSAFIRGILPIMSILHACHTCIICLRATVEIQAEIHLWTHSWTHSRICTCSHTDLHNVLMPHHHTGKQA